MALDEGWFSFSDCRLLRCIHNSHQYKNNDRKPSVAHPAASAASAVPTDGSEEAVHHLDAAEHRLDPTHDEQQGEERQVPRDDVFG